MLKVVTLSLLMLSVFSEHSRYQAKVFLDFRWAMATRVLKWLDLAARKCEIHTTIMPINSSRDLITQRLFQAFKRQKPYVSVLDVSSANFSGVLSPVYVYDRDLVNCLSLEEFKTCLIEKIDGITVSSEICASKIKQAATSGFKIAYFILMLILLILTLALSFFW